MKLSKHTPLPIFKPTKLLVSPKICHDITILNTINP